MLVPYVTNIYNNSVLLIKFPSKMFTYITEAHMDNLHVWSKCNSFHTRYEGSPMKSMLFFLAFFHTRYTCSKYIKVLEACELDTENFDIWLHMAMIQSNNSITLSKIATPLIPCLYYCEWIFKYPIVALRSQFTMPKSTLSFLC
jgi:hypothetical protein